MGKKSKNYHKEQKEKKQKVKSYGSFKELLSEEQGVDLRQEKRGDKTQKPKKTDIKGGKLLSDNFINPYIFLPIDEKVPDRKDNIGNLSGVIECSLDVKSPVFIPNTGKKFKYINGDVGEHHFSEFFSYEDLSEREDTVPIDPPKFPRIPGSELRGVIRNIYEQLTNSCFSVIDQKNLTNMRTGKPKQAALWDIATNKVYEAERVMLNTRGKSTKGKAITTTTYNSGDKIYIKKSSNTDETSRGNNTGFYVADDISTASGAGYLEGYVLIGEEFRNKHHDSVFIPLKTTIFSMDDKDISRFENVLKKYNGIKEDESFTNRVLTKYINYINYYLKCKKSKTGLVPIFYSEVTGAGGSKVHYVSSAMITREYFSNTISGILEKNSKHQPCDGSNGWCPACRLFGMVGQNNREDKTKKEKALASRLRFTDSDIIKEAEFASPGILPILGSPRISSSEFYLKKPEKNADFWNYDYYTEGDSSKLYKPTLKGRKVYWLGKSMALDPQMTEEIYDREGKLRVTAKTANLKQRTAVRSLKKGKTTFKVFFEDLTEEELACLLFCLQLKDFDKEDKNQFYHRIGRGKPYGMGAVEFKVDKLSFHTYELLDGEIKRSSDEKEKEDLAEYNLDKYDEKYKTAKERIQFYSKKLDDGEAEMVDYPKAKDEKGNITIYEWFVQNRGSIDKPKIRQCLPEFDNLMKGKRKKRLSTYRKN